LKKRCEGIDPDAVKALADEKRRLEEGAQLKAGEVEKVEARVKGSKPPFSAATSIAASVGSPCTLSGPSSSRPSCESLQSTPARRHSASAG